MSMPKTILLVEDEEDLADAIQYNLEREGYHCVKAYTGDKALEAISCKHPDLVLLDRMLPGLSGDELAIRLKRDPVTAAIPIIMLTAKGEESDQLVGFALGADDYVTKPFSTKLLMARIGVLLRRAAPREADGGVQSAGPITLDVNRHDLTLNGKSISLTATEFKLINALMGGNGRVMSRAQLIDRAMGEDVIVTDRTIDVHVTSLRKKLGAAAQWIQTVRGVGYTFRPPPENETVD